MNKIVSVIIGLLIISILVVLGVLASKNILHIEDKAGTWEFWSLYGLTIIMFISQFVLYKSYIDLRNSLIIEIMYSTGCRVSELCNM